MPATEGKSTETYTTSKKDKEGFRLVRIENTINNPSYKEDGSETNGNYQPGKTIEITYVYEKIEKSVTNKPFEKEDIPHISENPSNNTPDSKGNKEKTSEEETKENSKEDKEDKKEETKENPKEDNEKETPERTEKLTEENKEEDKGDKEEKEYPKTFTSRSKTSTGGSAPKTGVESQAFVGVLGTLSALTLAFVEKFRRKESNIF